MVADSMRSKYPGRRRGATRTPAGCAQNLVCTPPSAGEQPGEITWGEVFAVLPFGNRSVILTLTGAQLKAAFVNGFTPFCDPAFAGGTGRFPQISGLKVQFHCDGQLPVDRRRCGRPRAASAAGHAVGDADTDPDRHQRLHVHRRRRLHGFLAGTGPNVSQPGDDLLQVTIDYITANSPVGPVVDGRIDRAVISTSVRLQTSRPASGRLFLSRACCGAVAHR